ncbi:MerC domain-containing protein [Seonamhaeicola marinus]|uniref:MerC domain-containing protein n=2 Tax=Seonamhaeicola marinus TaxID=1912246 RepID=A0A5D0I6B8_9FLAO|nr:MerC domain-containing protein [Seonamhaeicola marinus]
MFTSLRKSDFIGVVSSALCLIHCLATPFLFIAQAHSAHVNEAKPIWWSCLDIIFLVLSFMAIYKTAGSTTKKWVKQLLWFNWALLTFIIVNEKVHWLPLPEAVVYFPSIALIALHIYNSKYCHCDDTECCVNNV